MKRLRTKVTLLFLAVAALSVLGTVFVSARILSADKGDYVTELNSIAAPHVALSIGKYLDYLENQMSITDDLLLSVQKSGKSQVLLQKSFQNLTGVDRLYVFDNRGLLASLGAQSGNPPAFGEDFLKIKNRRLLILENDYYFVTHIRERLYVARILLDSLREFFESAQVFSATLVSDKKAKEFIDVDNGVEGRKKHTVLAKRVKLNTGEWILAAVAPIPSTEGSMVLVQAPTAKVSEMVRQVIWKSLPLVIGIFALAIGLGWIFSLQLVRPIEELTDATSKIASGHWQVELSVKPKNEIGKLVDSFSKMGQELASRELALKKATDELLRSERLAVLGKFSAGVAHEVKNPLNSILGFAQLLQQRLNSADETVKKYVGFIMDETRRASRIISDLMAFARQKPPEVVSTKVASTVQKAFDIFSPQAAASKVNLKLDIREQDLIANLDVDQIFQVFSNLIINAIHALEEKPEGQTREIGLTLSKKDSFALIQVADNGSGISPENMKKLFEPFFSTKKMGKGTGLGLSMCHGIVSQHQGKIEVQSELGKGTCFEIYIPLAG